MTRVDTSSQQSLVSPCQANSTAPSAKADISFESLMRARSSNVASSLLSPSDDAVDASGLRTAIAEVFNAHGFFPVGHESFATSAQPPLDDPLGVAAEGCFEEPALLPRGPNASWNSSFAAKGEQGPMGVSDHAQRPIGTQSRAFARPSSSAVRVQSAGRASTTPVEEQQLHEAVALERGGQRRTLPGTQQRERMIFRIGTHLVELIARFDSLSPDEESRLVAELEAVLQSHGLSLADATINGKPMGKRFSERLR